MVTRKKYKYDFKTSNVTESGKNKMRKKKEN